MTNSKTEIANLAFSFIAAKEIGNLDSEASAEAEACRRHYDNALRRVLRAYPWSFANQSVTLGLVHDFDDDEDAEWSYSYRYPADCLRLLRIHSGQRTDSRDTRIAYKIGRDDDGLLIYTDEEDAIVEYTYLEENAARFPDDFIEALAYRLASLIVPRLTGGDPWKLQDRMKKEYLEALQNAQATGANEEQADEEPDSEFQRARG